METYKKYEQILLASGRLNNLWQHKASIVKSGEHKGYKWEVLKAEDGSFAYKANGMWSHDYNDPFMYDSESECVADAKAACEDFAKRKVSKR